MCVDSVHTGRFLCTESYEQTRAPRSVDSSSSSQAICLQIQRRPALRLFDDLLPNRLSNTLSELLLEVRCSSAACGTETHRNFKRNIRLEPSCNRPVEAVTVS